ncbi:Galns [Symbiodinium pilosum]|uniref:Galns protein n=1 Tax=Symbiodinium pilosum TaxID=2952 RepID=A0A812SRH4_SYMPI|nr:Galns [Symbiodinium pilosum]
MADDLGWGEVGLYPANSSHGRIATPHLDQFGREGVIFRQAYAGYTVCAPSRTAFFTGRHSGNFHKWGLNGESLSPSQGQTVLPQVLKQVGYRTGAFGKVAPLTSPLEQGFDTFLGQVDQALCHNMYPAHIDSGLEQLNFELSGNLGSKSRELCMHRPEMYNYTIDVFHDHGMAWLEAVADSGPFFLYMSYTIPHAGGWGDAPKSPESGNPVPCDLQYASKKWPDVEKDHAAVITYLDSKVGDLLSRLKSLNIDRNTLVFFASDNGAHSEGGHDHQFFNSTGGLRGYKRSMFEGGVRSPTMVRWPERIAPGRISDFAWAFWDVLPTIAEIAGVSIPGGLDGISILPELKGLPQKEHDYLYFTWIGDGPDGKGGMTNAPQPGIHGLATGGLADGYNGSPPSEQVSNREARNIARKATANYLLSISEDACFVSHSRASLHLDDWPLLTNLRAGAWYVPTDSVDATCYFKSMDGHRNQWDFSLARLNLHVAHMAAGSEGVILVDCTGNRRKTFPDSLSKTVPIWSAVLQTLAAILQAPGKTAEDFTDRFLYLHTAQAERAEIKQLLPEWDLDERRKELEALRSNHIIILCVSASKAVSGSRSYIQGAGDDEEAWAQQLRLTPQKFWRHAEVLLEVARSRPEEVDPVALALDDPKDAEAKPIEVPVDELALSFIGNTGIVVSDFASAAPPAVWDLVDAVLNCGGEEHPGMKGDPRYLHLPAADEKKHDPTKNWWQEVLLPRALRFIMRC